jgi:hypothetical protein
VSKSNKDESEFVFVPLSGGGEVRSFGATTGDVVETLFKETFELGGVL